MGRFTTSRVFAFGALLFLWVALQAHAQQKPEWTWKDRRGQMRTRAELDEILNKHRQWVESAGKSGTRASLNGAVLSGANLEGAVLVEAHMVLAKLDSAVLDKADLTSADLRMTDLTSADFANANLNGADLGGAVLTDAELIDAQLLKANLQFTQLKDANISGADLKGAIFEPKSNPGIRDAAVAEHLEFVTYRDNPDALVQLRKQFADGGFRGQERKITYALKRREAELSWEGCKSRKTGDKTRAILWSPDSNLANCGSFVLNRVFFDWTCQYGLSPGRPLSLGVLVWALCSILYFVSIRASGEAGLYRVFAQSIHDDPSGQKRVEKISPPAITQTGRVRRLLQFVKREWAALRASMFFSLMSAFNIGFRDINFGRWLRLLTRQEFDMKAVGWARVVAGWQSLISVYFIALWVLTYFGRPFE